MMSKSKGKIKRFIGTLGPWKVAIVAAMILAIGSTVCTIFGPKLLGEITNTAVEGYVKGGELDWGKLGGIAWALVALYGVAAILNYLQGAILSVVAAKYAEKKRSEILAKISRLPVSYFDKHQIGDTLSRMSNDVGMVADTLSQILTQIITSVTTLVGILIMMMTISIPLSLVALVAVPLSVVVVSFVAKKAQGYFRAQQATLGKLNSVIEEDFSGQALIKANSHIEASQADFERTNGKLYEASWKAQFYSSLAFPVAHIFTNLNYVLICVIGGKMAIDGTLMIGGVQAFIQYVSSFNRPITEVSQITSHIQQALAAAERIFEFLDAEEESLEPEGKAIEAIRGEVEFCNVGFEYEEGKPIIKDFSVKIKAGSQVAIVGPTGAGKTTIINLLMRFYDPTTGYITIDGVPTKEMARNQVRGLFGMVLQDTWLFSGTIEENLKYGNAKATEEGIREAAKTASVHHFIESLAKGYKTEISEDSDNISAGEKQLLTIVRALVADPPMMILDEATSNVDTRTEQLIQDAFVKLTEGRTSFVIAHRLSTIRNADLILVMKEGEIVEQGRHKELLARGGFYAELYNSQFKD